MKRPAAAAAEYLNVDLEVRSRSDLKPLADTLSPRLFALYVGREGRSFLASFEVPGTNLATPDAAFRRLLRAIDDLPGPAARLWRQARDRVFDVGVARSKGKGVLRLPLKVGTLAAVARHQARVALTIYPD